MFTTTSTQRGKRMAISLDPRVSNRKIVKHIVGMYVGDITTLLSPTIRKERKQRRLSNV